MRLAQRRWYGGPWITVRWLPFQADAGGRIVVTGAAAWSSGQIGLRD
ncbi:MAG: hypothetical protein ABSH50_03725 [Bryobacteraceae bacterium]|jgi:hypothetical protein